MTEPVWYRIDANDTIVEVGGGWNAFAEANGAPELATEAVGRSLWDFVQDSFTRDIYDRLLERTSARGRVSFNYRCDAPAKIREYRMTIEQEPAGGARFSNELVRSEDREPVALLDTRVDRTEGPLLTVCGWCKRGHHRGEWVSLETLVARGLFREAPFPVVSHGICGGCEARVFGDDDAT